MLVQPDVIAHVMAKERQRRHPSQNLPPSGSPGFHCSSSSVIPEVSEDPPPSLSPLCSVFYFLEPVGWISLSSAVGTSPAKLVSLRNFRPQSREPEQMSETIR